jgi:hypothetical protein
MVESKSKERTKNSSHPYLGAKSGYFVCSNFGKYLHLNAYVNHIGTTCSQKLEKASG